MIGFMKEEEFILYDRIQAIQMVNAKYDLEHNGYLSFSGGKDSTVVHYLLDLALPGNNIPRVYIDTGIEYNSVRKFVSNIAYKDKRFSVIKPNLPIKKVLDVYGYPFKSKEHSSRVYEFNRGSTAEFLQKYISGIDKYGNATGFSCPKCLKYQFENRGEYNYSNLCCQKLKKQPAHAWEKKNGRYIAITGMRSDEGGNRVRLGCIIGDGKGSIRRFHPLIKCNGGFEDWLISKYNIILPDLYYPPFNFKRTGCKGCPFSLDLARQLKLMELYLPNERKQCEFIWGPVYSEYRRIGFRLCSSEQLILF